jgi:hypothetical protein
VRLRELASGLIFYGVLGTDPVVRESAEIATQELADLGLGLSDALIRVWPLPAGEQALPATPSHAGTWRPGSIHVRPGNAVWLRHELMHEAMHRHCSGRLPRWALEAAAIAFSGEATTLMPALDVDLDSLRHAASLDRPLGRAEYNTLRWLAANRGWKPSSPCAIPENWIDLSNHDAKDFSWVLRHVVSGRILAKGGDQDRAEPPGSLMKLVLFAAIKAPSDQKLSRQLATLQDSLLRSENFIQTGKMRSEMIDWDLLSDMLQIDFGSWSEKARQGVLEDIAGYRDSSGDFLISRNLNELSELLRHVLLGDPQRFAFLERQVDAEGATLAGSGHALRQVMKRLRAGAKTGTIAATNGSPLTGHVAFFWPVERPQFLFVAKASGVNGASVGRRSSDLLSQLAPVLEPFTFVPRIQVMSRLSKAQWRLESPCGLLPHISHLVTSRCGVLTVQTTAPKSRAMRFWSGTVQEKDDRSVLESDPWTWAEDVVAAEGDNLPTEAKRALHLIALYNAKHGQDRHMDSICDLTHCMVGRGRTVPKHKVFTLNDLQKLSSDLRDLETLARANHAGNWLEFSLGGDQPWSRSVDARFVAAKLGAPDLIEIHRIRGRSGLVSFQIERVNSVETLSCEVLRNRLKLLSCPDQVRFDAKSNTWTFSGLGEGHGRGVDLTLAARLAREGHLAGQILVKASQGFSRRDQPVGKQ